MENNVTYNVLYKTVEQICKKCFKEQYEKYFKKKRRNISKTLTEQGFFIQYPHEVRWITKELLPKAIKNEITEEEAKVIRISLIKLGLLL